MKKLFSFLLFGAMFVSFTACEQNDDVNGGNVTNSHEYVDLGLPSGTLWATCNVGAINPEDYGKYFAWGETKTKSEYNWSTYKYCNGSYNSLTKYCTDSSSGTVDNKTTLEPSDDAAATVNLGGEWRTPTWAEVRELLNECDCEWTENYNNTGVVGYIVTGPNGNSIFLPAAGYRDNSRLKRVGAEGYYWSSSIEEGYSNDACCLCFYSDHYERFYSRPRSYGLSVRPVSSSR